MISGSCNCGAVAFELRSEPQDMYICHCSICRRWTGANGVAVIVVPNVEFHWTRGESQVRRWRHADRDWLSCFCGTCGSALPGPNDDDHMFVPAGLLGSPPEHLRVAAHIWVGSKAPWDVIGDDGHQHREGMGS